VYYKKSSLPLREHDGRAGQVVREDEHLGRETCLVEREKLEDGWTLFYPDGGCGLILKTYWRLCDWDSEHLTSCLFVCKGRVVSHGHFQVFELVH
jgi:hypothetical protein